MRQSESNIAEKTRERTNSKISLTLTESRELKFVKEIGVWEDDFNCDQEFNPSGQIRMISCHMTRIENPNWISKAFFPQFFRITVVW